MRVQAYSSTPLQQLWRQHMLAAAMINNGFYGAGCREY
jgi:hypothetical protein